MHSFNKITVSHSARHFSQTAIFTGHPLLIQLSTAVSQAATSCHFFMTQANDLVLSCMLRLIDN